MSNWAYLLNNLSYNLLHSLLDSSCQLSPPGIFRFSSRHFLITSRHFLSRSIRIPSLARLISRFINMGTLLLDLWSIDLSGAREKEGHFHNKNFLRALKWGITCHIYSIFPKSLYCGLSLAARTRDLYHFVAIVCFRNSKIMKISLLRPQLETC